MELYVAVWIVSAFGAAAVARWWGARNLVSWFLLGLLLGPLGVGITVVGAKE